MTPLTFPGEGGSVYFREADAVSYTPTASCRLRVRAQEAGVQTRKECRHGKANDSRGQGAHRLPAPAGLDTRPDSGGQRTQQVHHPPRDNQPLGPLRERLQVLEPDVGSGSIVPYSCPQRQCGAENPPKSANPIPMLPRSPAKRPRKPQGHNPKPHHEAQTAAVTSAMVRLLSRATSRIATLPLLPWKGQSLPLVHTTRSAP